MAEKITAKDRILLSQGIWPGTKELVVGVVDEETGVVSEEIRIQPGEKIPARAWQLIKEQIAAGTDPIEVPFGKTGYSKDLVQRSVGKTRN